MFWIENLQQQNTQHASRQQGFLCYWGMTNNHQPKSKPVFSFGLTSIFCWQSLWLLVAVLAGFEYF
jgi:hypothetical protein